MAALGPAAGDGGLRALYRWVDAVPLSRPRRNIARDFSDGGARGPGPPGSRAGAWGGLGRGCGARPGPSVGPGPASRPCPRASPPPPPPVLAAELVKFFFPAMVQLHSYVPASSTPQKLANWGHLNRKVLSKLNFSLPDEVIRQVVQCRPGTVEQVLLLLRQKIEEKQKQSKAVPGPEQELGARTAQEEVGYLETGRAGYSEAKSTGQGCAQESPGAAGGSRSHLGYARHPAGDTAAIHLQLAEKEQALLLAQEAVQLLQMKVRRLEQLLRLKDTRIDDLSRRLQQAQRQPR
uniref:Sperm flagellar 1 n=1 Tax=Anser cygnoides TaxID=8845 RepID=A0A8B9ECD5_ANSCY